MKRSDDGILFNSQSIENTWFYKRQKRIMLDRKTIAANDVHHLQQYKKK